MILKKYFIYLLLFFTAYSYSQVNNTKSFSLEWNLEAELKASDGTGIAVPLVKGQTVDQNGLPVFCASWESQSGGTVSGLELVNVVYEKLDTRYLKNIPVAYLSDQIQSNLVISNKEAPYAANFMVVPLVKEGGTVKRIVSFDIKYRLSQVYARRAAKSAVTDSPLSSGTWYKFSVDKTGVFKIDANFLNELGISTSGLDPRNIRIFGNGGAMLPNLNSEFRYANLQENDIYVQGEGDGSFDGGDYVLFYAQGPHNWEATNENDITHHWLR